MLKNVFFVYYVKFNFLRPRIAQGWAQRLRNEPDWDVYEKQTNKVNRKKIKYRTHEKIPYQVL